MNILWIDDFDEKKTSEGRVSFVEPFKGFLTEGIQERLDELGKSKTDNAPESLQEILQDNTHPIYWYDGFVSGLDAIVETVPFDFIILDAKMPTDDGTIEKDYQKASCEEKTRNQITFFKGEGVFPKEDDLYAGLTLYFYLVQERGYPRDRVVFLSANIEKAEDIKSNFRAAKVIPPTIFTKDEDGNSKFQKTLEKFSKSEHLNLRRGMLDMLDQIEKQSLSTKPPFDEKNDDPINVTAFVNGLRFLLNDHRIPSSEKDIQRFYLVLCDYLTKPFERFSIESLSRGSYRWKVRVSKEYVMPAYFMRNWIAHDVMNNSHSQLSAKDVGFIFIIVIKSLFNHSCLEAFKTLYAVPDKPIDLIGLLAELHEKNYSSPPECDIFELIRLKGEKGRKPTNWKNEPFVAHLYASFLFHSLEQCSTDVYKEGKTAYYFKLRYRIASTKDDFFEGLKPIAYQRLQELKSLLPPKQS